jgi:hypothetical protein
LNQKKIEMFETKYVNVDINQTLFLKMNTYTTTTTIDQFGRDLSLRRTAAQIEADKLAASQKMAADKLALEKQKTDSRKNSRCFRKSWPVYQRSKNAA